MKRTLFIIMAVVAAFLLIGALFTSMSMQSSGNGFPASRDFGYGGGAATEAPAMEAGNPLPLLCMTCW